MTLRFTAVVQTLATGTNGPDGIRVELLCPFRYSQVPLILEAARGEAEAYRIGMVVEIAITPQGPS